MVRPARSRWVPRAYARHRHRTWMRSMLLATTGWSVWWLHVLLLRFQPELAPPHNLCALLGALFGGPGLLLAVWTLRAQASWLMFTAAPIFANGSLLVFPLLTKGLFVEL